MATTVPEAIFPDELRLSEGDCVCILDQSPDGYWYIGLSMKQNRTGRVLFWCVWNSTSITNVSL
jgi:hypothetical protein